MKRKELESLAAKVGGELKTKMPTGTGFIVLVFDFGEAGNLAYMSTCERREAIAVMREWIRKMEES